MYKIVDRNIPTQAQPTVMLAPEHFEISLQAISNTSDQTIYELELKADLPQELSPLIIQWRIPAINIKGVWTSNALHEKRLRADWEPPSIISRISVDAPVLCLFGNQDENQLTIACADVINTVEIEAPLREENAYIYCTLRFFTEQMPKMGHYKTQILLDTTAIQFSQVLQQVSNWWTAMDSLKPAFVPSSARVPLYSTWYSYHQNFTIEALLEECRIAKGLGYELIIIDDGWQTLDTNRGYDYTGDWYPERIPNMAEFVQEVHKLGMKIMLWYSVPFCGKKSEAYQQFKGKFLTENHHWAPVFDPRYPEVRAYLVQKYSEALKEWNIDGFKLDFIDDFRVYAETILNLEDGRDCASVNEGVDRLLAAVYAALQTINSDVLIEFRQRYTGPALRKYGNMFRAFDCPLDHTTNRIRTTDVKLLCGNSAVHSDMFLWHPEESVEIAALQITSILFSVPQLSVRLAEIPESHHHMIAFYTSYWIQNKSTLLDGAFTATGPLENYALLSARTASKLIVGIYANQLVEIKEALPEIDLINGKSSAGLQIKYSNQSYDYQIFIYTCTGDLIQNSTQKLEVGLYHFEVPPAGMLCMQRIN